MKFLIAFALAVAVVHADVSHVVNKGYERSAEAAAEVLRSEADVKPDGFQYSFETSNGIAASESGVVKDPNSDHPTQSVSGEFKFTSPEGVPVHVTYVADENGYQPSGDSLPVPPPIPQQIQRALEYIAAHPQPVDPVVRTVQSAAQVSAQASAQAYKPAFNKRF